MVLVGDPNLNLHLPLLLGGGTTQWIISKQNMICLVVFYPQHLRLGAEISTDDMHKKRENSLAVTRFGASNTVNLDDHQQKR